MSPPNIGLQIPLERNQRNWTLRLYGDGVSFQGCYFNIQDTKLFKFHTN